VNIIASVRLAVSRGRRVAILIVKYKKTISGACETSPPRIG
jgi:hypothetical protein